MAPRSAVPTSARRWRRRATLLGVALFTLVALAGCWHRARVAEPDDESAAMPVPEYVFVNVENHNWGDVVVSLINSGGQRIRLGTVAAASSATLRFPGSYIASSQAVQLQARAIGGRAVVNSERFTVGPGQQVTWTLETSLARSSLAVY